jgi:hypothetical protein
LALKLSIGTFLLRVVNSRVQRYTIYGVLLVVTLYSIAYLCMVIFQCIPVSHFVSIPIEPSTSRSTSPVSSPAKES